MRRFGRDQHDVVLDSAERAMRLIGTRAFEKSVRNTLEIVGDILAPAVRGGEAPGFLAPLTVETEGKGHDGAILLLSDRAVLAWSTGILRGQNFAEEIPYDSIERVEAAPERRSRGLRYLALVIRSSSSARTLLFGSLHEPMAAYVQGILRGDLARPGSQTDAPEAREAASDEPLVAPPFDFPSLLPIGGEPDDAFLEPRVDGTGSFVLEQDERMLAAETLDIEVSELRRGTWRQLTAMKTKGLVVFTDRRLLLAWPSWKRDPGSGSLFERRVLANLAEREENTKLLLAGHLRQQWIGAIFYDKPKGRFRGTSSIRVDAQAVDDSLIAVRVEPLDADRTEPLVADFAATIASARLSGCDAIDADAEATLRGHVDRSHRPEELDWGLKFVLPGAKRIGFDY